MYKHRRLIKLAFILLFLSAALIARIFLSRSPKNKTVIIPAPVSANKETARNDISPPKEILKEIADLRKKYNNGDIIGHIYIEGTSVDYPVAQYTDNDFYLDHNLNKKSDKRGAIYLDYENSLDILDRNSIIYGHNMKANEMFHAIRYYRDEAYFKEHPRIVFTTLYEKTEWEVFAFMKAPAGLYYLEVNPPRAKFKLLINEIKRLSFYDTGVTVTDDDKILHLSTCSVYSYEDMYRYVLSAKLAER